MEYKVNQKIWHIKIDNAVKERSYSKNGVKVEELKIIGISKYKICLNNDWFTALDVVKEDGRKERGGHYTYMDDVNTSIRTKDSILGDGIFISLYSTKKPTKRLLEKMVAHASVKIYKEYGFLVRGATSVLYDYVKNYEIN